MLKQVEQYFLEELGAVYDAQECKQLFILAAQELLNLSRSQVLLGHSRELTATEKEKFKNIVNALTEKMPLQYALGTAWFYGMKLLVSPSVLIPRPETEELVDLILKQDPASQSFLDIGTGSGCIAIAIKKNQPDAHVWAVDISSDALTIAKANAEKQGCTVQFKQVDILSSTDPFADQKFDVIVSNPPYITPTEQLEMEDHVLDYEPHLALFIPEERPLLFYEAIADFALNHLNPNGKLYFEINRRFGQELKEQLEAKGFVDVQVYLDMQAADRMIMASLP